MKNKLKAILKEFKADKESNIYKAVENLVSLNDTPDYSNIQNKYELLFNNSRLAYQSLDKLGNIIDVNPIWLYLLGYERDEVIGKPFSKFIHADFIDQFNSTFNKLIKEGIAKNAQLKLKNKNGNYILVSYESCVLFNTNDNFQSTYCSFRDITKETEIFNALKENEEKYKKLIHNQGEGIGITDKNEVFTFSNPAADHIFGVKKGELIGKSLKDFLSDEELEKIKKETKKRKTGKESCYELKITNEKGEIKHLLVTVTPDMDEHGNYISSFGIFRDITHRKEIEKALIESEEKFKAITNSAQDAIILINEKGKIILWNKAATDIFQYTSNEVINKDLHKIIAPQIYKDLYTKGFGKFVRTGKGNAINKVIELKGKRKDGVELPIELSLSVLKIKDKWHSVGILRDISIRKDSEAVLTLSEERFRAIFEMNTDLIGIANVNTATFFKVNPAFTKTLGYMEDEFLDKSFIEFIHPDDIDKTKNIIEKNLKHGQKTIRFINRYRCKNGDYRILEWTAYPVPEKRIFYAVAHDITKQTQDEKKLRESEERFKMLTELTFEGIIIHKDTVVSDCNQAFLNITGYKKEEIINKNLLKLISKEYQSLVKENIQKQVAKPYEISVMKKDGSVIPVEIESRDFRFNNRTLHVAAIKDITERKKIQEKIIDNESRFRLYIITSPICILISDSKGVLTFINPAASKLLGYSQSEFLKMSILDLHPEEDHPTIKQDFEVLNTKGRIIDKEYRFKHKNGEIIYAILEGVNLSKNENIAFCVNITERKKYEANLKELNTTKDKFFSIIAHDLRAPMNNLVGFSNLLDKKHQSYTKEKLAHIIGILNTSVKQTFSLLESLLIWSNSQRNKLDYRPEKVICKDIINEVIIEMQNIAIAKEIKIKSQKGLHGFPVVVDIEMFKTILRNLISNAIKFTKEGGVISIGCEKTENHMVKFIVSDTGVGIPKENIDKLFRIDQNITTVGTKDELGTGLGLILCKEFVERHGGKIWVESLTEDSSLNNKSGSRFYFTIPYDKE